MVKEIFLYVEGGGDNSETRSELRRGFGKFLKEVKQIARDRHIHWNVVACGSRHNAYEDFCTGLQSRPRAFHVLLVDSESAVSNGSNVWTHLKRQDGWDCPIGADEEHCFLMAQSMETWVMADRKTLEKYYGAKFWPNALPSTSDIETIDKQRLLTALKAATKDCQPKGPYHKTKHGFDILGKSDPKIVREAASQCNRLFDCLSEVIGNQE